MQENQLKPDLSGRAGNCLHVYVSPCNEAGCRKRHELVRMSCGDMYYPEWVN